MSHVDIYATGVIAAINKSTKARPLLERLKAAALDVQVYIIRLPVACRGQLRVAFDAIVARANIWCVIRSLGRGSSYQSSTG